MPIDLDRYNNLKKKETTFRREADKALGALEQLHQQLAREFNCQSIKEAETKLKELEREEKLATTEYEKELAALEKKLNELDGGQE